MRPDEYPTASVIIPVYNSPDDLREALESVTEQTYPDAQYEVVVVDNDSEDHTEAVAREFAAAYPDLVTAESETEIQTSYAARNTGIAESDGTIVAFMDADVTVDPDWLESGVRTMLDRDAEYLACRVEVTRNEGTLVGKYDSLTGFPVEQYVEECRFAPTCGLFVAREVFDDVGTFDERLVSGGDAVFGNQVAESGRELHYADDVTVYHPARSTLGSLLRKHVRVGRGLAQRKRWYSGGGVASSVLPPARYLPPDPFRLHRRFGAAWEDLSASEKAGMYAIEYLKKLSRTVGRLQEFVRMAGADVGGGRLETVGELPAKHDD